MGVHGDRLNSPSSQLNGALSSEGDGELKRRISSMCMVL